jgi:hypothetical protein
LSAGSGGGFEGDRVAEGLELADVEDNETPDDELESDTKKYIESATKSINSQAEAGTRNIAMVRKLFAAFPVGTEESGSSEMTQLQKWADVFRELHEEPMSKPCQVQSITLLANVIRWFSTESDRSEEEILEQLEKPYLESRDESLSRMRRATERLRGMG